ncbi:MAG TPA: hypothetical protein ENO30_04675 [Thermodesulfobium narugense]|nr:hypothetical protein [Thermodesulfobium narugense]
MRKLTAAEIREQVSGLLSEDWFMRGITNQDDFVYAVLDNLEVLSRDEKVDFDVEEAKRIAEGIWNEEGEAIANKYIEEEIRRIESMFRKADEEYKRVRSKEVDYSP